MFCSIFFFGVTLDFEEGIALLSVRRMALVSGGRSTLNPNAPLFIPAAVRQVEDFSPEWWYLINTAAWFRDYWLSQQQGEDSLYGNGENEFGGHNVIDMLPDSIDLVVDEDLLNMEEQFEEFIRSSESGESSLFFSTVKELPANGACSEELIALLNAAELIALHNRLSTFERTSTFRLIEKYLKSVFGIDSEAVTKAPSLSKSFNGGRIPKIPGPKKYWEKPAKQVNPKCSPRRIQQPR